jgi:D-alanyl-lipoteichoic acid acyltransferase DltB (MBOAT superfamily)
MLFNSSEFLLFFVVVALLAHHSGRQRWLVLLAASYVFYMAWSPPFLLLLTAQTLFCWATALRIDGAATPGRRRAYLAANVVVNLALLGFFKYFYFFHDSLLQGLDLFVREPFSIEHPWTIVLPLGISFHTFQGIAYAVDVYRGQIRAERDLRFFALFHSFFPQLIAGPIERASSLLPQMRFARPFAPDRLRSGMRWFTWGLFKKTCIADPISPIVGAVYAQPADYHASYLLLATVLFGLQIYCDFSGYSEMALGAARILGIDLTMNFRQPYLSTSLAEFWRRWHITLSFWFRDYVYFPLGGNRVTGLAWARNIMVVFLLSGLWHGAAWTFVIWGAIHGLWLLVEKAFHGLLPLESSSMPGRWSSLARWLATIAIVQVSWVFFRADSLATAWYVLVHSCSGFGPLEYQAFKAMGTGGYELVTLAFNLLALMAVDLALAGRVDSTAIWKRSRIRAALLVLLAYDIACNGVFQHAEFIYFQF